MSGQEGELSPSQERMLAQVRWGREPYTGLNFSFCPRRARSFDLEKSDDMLQKVKFRKQQDLHNILAWQPPEVVRLYNANGTCGHDNEGSPMWYHIIRGLDLKGLFLSISRQKLLRAKSQSCGLSLRELEKIIAVFDFEGLSQRHLWKPGVEFAQEFLTALEANYPEILRNIIVVRGDVEATRQGTETPGDPETVPFSACKLFPVAFNLIKPYITEEMRRKVLSLPDPTWNPTFAPTDSWKQELPKFTSPDQLPVEFGGTMTDTDGNPKCLTKINYGGKVPRSYYLRNQVRVQYKHQVTMGRGSSLQVENEILFPGCVLRWQFALDEVDIGFGVFLKTKMGEWQRAGEMMEDGSLTCLQAGANVLRFDNTYSLMHAKRVSYTVEVLLPDKASEEKIQKNEDENPEDKLVSTEEGSYLQKLPLCPS
ncbi:hypothetical protein EI555_012713 [Monodon monoceros]|uniref:CRAL-TRIO domain-containing protein n=1 Tax=Monodon monoceros TaxID=40151 RepID=A0A4U1F5T5_MONMO|nr:hypothetical protein EI555_012713 [Monodon monoceros]